MLFPSKLMIGRRYSNLAEHSLHNWIGHHTAYRARAEWGLASSFSRSVHSFASNGFMLRNGGEISNFTTGITPRYWARMTGCGFGAGGFGCAEALPNAKSTSVIAAKHSKTATKTRSLKKAD